MRAITIAAVIAVTAATLATATPTTPFKSKTYNLPRQYLLDKQDSEGNWKMEISKDRCSTAEGKKCKETAWIRYNASNMDLGWDFTHVATEGESWYHAGYLEGFVTAASITNVLPMAPQPDSDVSKWVDEHIEYMVQKARNFAPADPYWRTVGKILEQLVGLTDGYNAATNGTVGFKTFFLMSFADEVGDVQTHFKELRGDFARSNNMRTDYSEMMKQSHCSALIKPTHDDLFMAHDTWTEFPQMAYRAYKVYEFKGAAKVTLSGYPAQVASGDDWYYSSHDMSIQETTNFVWNTTLFTAVVPQTVSEFIRVMTANYLASSGEEWTHYFAKENSGTYNNQYMVVDYKKYDMQHENITDRLKDGMLWVAEQIPGFVEKADQTHVIRTQGYWASYNIAFYPFINAISGYPEMVAKFGSLFDYHKYARPEIFRRNESHVKDLSSMQHMMRYNNWKHDEYSLIPNCSGTKFDGKCKPQHSAVLSIASRGDIMPYCNSSAEMRDHYGPISGPWVALPCFGAIDSKIASYKRRKSLAGVTISGPTNDQQPTFSWETSNCNRAAPANSPPTFDFPWVEWEL